MTSKSSNWGYLQHFGEGGDSRSNKTCHDESSEADLITAVEFDPTGKYVATGDKGGCICIFKSKDLSAEPRRTSFWKKSSSKKKARSYQYHTDFQSHEPEFDYLKSLEIEEKINKIKWCHKGGNSLMLLSTNDKTIKLWKVKGRHIRSVGLMNNASSPRSTLRDSRQLSIPKVTKSEEEVKAANARKFGNAHAYHINSISVCSDGETFLSSDDLRVNLWSLHRSDRSFNIVDIKPENMEELTEVITSAVFHPHDCHTFMFSSSCGKIMLGDLRASAICDAHMKCMYEPDDSSNNSFFSEIIASISDIKFSGCGKYAISRNYLGIKVWDLAMAKKPVTTISINNHLKPKLCDLYENDCIFDKFELAVSGNGSQIVTGAYHNFFHVFDRNGKRVTDMRATKPAAPSSPTQVLKRKFGKKRANTMKENQCPLNPDDVDFNQKILHVAWHPTENKVAMAAKESLYIYSGPKKS